MLAQRVITAIVLLLLFFATLFASRPEFFSAFGFSALVIAAWEWSRLSDVKSVVLRVLYTILLAMIFAFLANDYYRLLPENIFLPELLQQDFLRLAFFIAVIYWLFMASLVFRYPRINAFFHSSFCRLLYGVILLITAWLSLLYLRGHVLGQFWVLYVVAIIAAADIGAYFFGRHFGQHKLAIAVSPGKTWEGFYGGLFFAQVVALAFYWQLDVSVVKPKLPLFLLVALILSSVSVLGDLSESMIKRIANCKDSGTILPGHGGVLDRIDGLTAALPLFALCVMVFSW